MTAHRATNWVLALIIALSLGSLYRLDAPTDHSTEMAQAQAMEDAIRSEAAQDRFALAAAQICGNGGWVQKDDASVRCVVRKPLRGGRAAL